MATAAPDRSSTPAAHPTPELPIPAITPADLGFGELFWRMRDAVAVTNAATGRIVLWNPAAERIYGYTAQEAAQLSATTLIPERVRGEVLQELARFAATGRNRFTEAEGAIEYPIIRKDGQEIVVEATALPLDPPEGSQVKGPFLLSISRDVTERRRAEAQRERWARHAALRADVSAALNAGLPLPQVLRRCTDAVVHHLGAAFARIWTLSPIEPVLLLQASSGLYTHLDGPHGRVPVGAFKIGKIAEERTPHLTNDVQHDPRVGDKAWAAREGMVAFAGYPLVVEDRLLGVLALFAREPLPSDTLDALAAVADIVAHGIERARAERALRERGEALERSNADLEQFAYVASHDLQEPLRTVVSYLQLLETDYRDTLGETGREFLQYAVDGAQRMQTLIDDLLSYSRIGRRGRAMQPVSVDDVLRDVLADLRGAIEDTRASVTSDPLPVVHGDPAQLTQLLQNLIGNALKFRGAGPPVVHVSASPEDQPPLPPGSAESLPSPAAAPLWHFSVRDNGIGIEPAYHEQIFVIFQRLHVRDEYPGTGIGLAVCKKIVERHGGKLWVESSPGVGSTFHFTLPAAV